MFTPVLAQVQIDYVRRWVWLAETDATILATVVSSVIASLFAWWLVTHVTARYELEQDIHQRIGKLIELSMQYPIVDLESTREEWPNGNLLPKEEVQYQNYCCFVFNLVSDVWKWSGKNPKKANKLLYLDELIHDHQKWWTSEPRRDLAYTDPEFIQFVKQVIGSSPPKKKVRRPAPKKIP